MPTTILYHSADPDGWFSQAVCEKFLSGNPGKIISIGWDYGQPTPLIPPDGDIYMVDICIDELLADKSLRNRILWIDHHKSAIEKWKDEDINGLRVDGVAACRLCWLWWQDTLGEASTLDWSKQQVGEPEALFLVGLRDVWKHTGTAYEDNCNWLNLALIAATPDKREDLITALLNTPLCFDPLGGLLEEGKAIEKYVSTTSMERAQKNAMTVYIEEHGLFLLTINTTSKGSMVLDAYARKLIEAGAQIDGLMVWNVDGQGKVNVSLYHAPGKTDIDLSVIAVKYGGGGHRGACGFRTKLSELRDLLNL